MEVGGVTVCMGGESLQVMGEGVQGGQRLKVMGEGLQSGERLQVMVRVRVCRVKRDCR